MSYDLTILGKPPEIDDQKLAEAKKAWEELQSQTKGKKIEDQESYWETYRTFANEKVPGWREYWNHTFYDFVGVIVATKMGRYTMAPPLVIEMPAKNASGNQEAYAEYLEAKDSWLTEVLPNDEGTGIALHKFGSNDGWMVTERECAEAVSAWEDVQLSTLTEEQHAVVEAERWGDFIEFLRWASTHGGLKVG
ncbi:hypothetical protein [Glutamicibacter ardleyensis]|uniref:hypothetical protein n=1 Tax=Glutamicibacter ardleyensis TaxID=225894 RepID=UPI003FD6B2C7